MMKDKKVKFEKVSFDQFFKDCESIGFDVSNKETIKKYYDNIELPSVATHGSVGYDFYLPFDITLEPGESIMIPSGIRCSIPYGYSLDIYPKSGIGTKYHLVLANTIGIIDADYYESSNEGHIMIVLVNQSFYTGVAKYYYGEKNVEVGDNIVNIGETFNRKQGQSYVQGIIHECFGAINDYTNDKIKIRDGGFDSTSK